MLPFEDEVADYVKETDNHVLYRVTPVFDGDNLVLNSMYFAITSSLESVLIMRQAIVGLMMEMR